MTALRQLGMVYIATAGAFTVVLSMSAHPNWPNRAENAATVSRADVVASDTTTPRVPVSAGTARVAQRLRDNLTRELFANFELFLYVSKADSGPWAQRMYVFRKQANGDLALLYDWPVSTGRERIEFNPAGRRMATFTPQGYYELDPKRFYARYRSTEWGKPMPYTMFFNWIRDGNQTGLAIHAATGDDIARLGKRASAGCVHLAPENARTLFTLIRSRYRGLAPRFVMDRRTATMSNDGILLHDASGRPRMAEGYKVLVFIENYGGDNVVAALF
jgi:lipoprotein-anchoring transpeptidase ErfK/SrfK